MTPVRRSTRIANLKGKPTLNLEKPKGLEIDLDDLGITFHEGLEILDNKALPSEDNMGIIEGIKNCTILH